MEMPVGVPGLPEYACGFAYENAWRPEPERMPMDKCNYKCLGKNVITNACAPQIFLISKIKKA